MSIEKTLLTLTLFIGIILIQIQAQQCETCQNQAQCCGGEMCCGIGDSCCPKTTSCCNDTCCDLVTQDCCSDPQNGGVCCEKETTFCCKAEPLYDIASRCCPRWNACCIKGRFGCCNPGTGKAADNMAFALFDEGTWSGDTVFKSLQIELSSGIKTEQVVSNFNDWGEMTRVFAFDPHAELFYLPQANFVKDIGTITLYTVDPAKGTTTSHRIQGASNLVTGFVYDTNKHQLFMATADMTNGERTGYLFYTVDTTTAVATLHSKSNFTQTGEDDYLGWFSAISEDSSTVYRLGYKDVFHQQTSGVGITDVSSPYAKSTFRADIPIPREHEFYKTFDLYGDSILSLSPSEESIFDPESLDLVKWKIGGSAEVIATFYDAHTTPYFGPIATYVDCQKDIFAALVVHNSIDSTYDRWAMVVVDLKTNKKHQYNISPWMMAQSDSISGFGIPASSMLLLQ